MKVVQEVMRNIVPLMEMPTFSMHKASPLGYAVYQAREKACALDGMFLVRNTRADIPPDSLIYTSGSVGFAGQWFLARVRKAMRSDYEILVHKPSKTDVHSPFIVYCPTKFSLIKALRDLEERGSQSFFNPVDNHWITCTDGEFRRLGLPK